MAAGRARAARSPDRARGRRRAPILSARLLRHPRLAVLALAQFLSIAGDRLSYLALVSLLTARSAGGSASGLVALGQAMLLPSLLFAPFAGPLIDRWSLIAVLVLSDLARAALVGGLPTAYDLAGTGALLAGVFLAFTANVFFLPARSALPPRLVHKEELLGANALLVVGAVVATVLGAGLGGRLVDAIGWRAALYLDAATFALSAVLLAGLRGSAPGAIRRRRMNARRYARSLWAGARLLSREGPARRALVAWLGLWVGGGFLHVAGALHAQSRPGEVARLGILIAGFGVGVTASGTWAMTRPSLSPRAALGGTLIGGAAGLAMFAATQIPATMLGAAVWTGLCVGPLLAAVETEIQRTAGPRRRGRAFAGRDFASRLAFLLSTVAAGLLTRSAGPKAALFAGAVAIALLGGWVLRAAPER